MKISIITVCYNSANTIEDVISSVAKQTYRHNIDYIVIDGDSKDNTKDLINRHSALIDKWVSEPDSGIYDAMNKGLKLATGEIVGFLNSDDVFENDRIIETIANCFDNNEIDACYGDLVYVSPNDPNRVVRYFNSSIFTKNKIQYGIMPAHPTLYLKKTLFDKYGNFKTCYRIASDFELVARLFGKVGIKSIYIPKVLVKMRTGGISTKNLFSNYIVNKEMLAACRENGIKTNIFNIYLKYFQKIFELVKRP